MATRIDTLEETETTTARPWVVVLYNDDVHAIDEVVLQVQKATGKSEDEAYRITLEAHNTGKSVAYDGALEECQRVAGVLRRIRLLVEVDEG
ncbi:MAG: ATP-dependent Clp protease adaptor ClpS [Planctomycetota bacterium JB042]